MDLVTPTTQAEEALHGDTIAAAEMTHTLIDALPRLEVPDLIMIVTAHTMRTRTADLAAEIGPEL